MSDLAWYALRCATRQEALVQTRLEALGFEVLLPVEIRWRRTRRTRERARRPLFLGYLFVRCAPDRLFSLQRVDGVHHPVGWRDAEGLRHPVVIAGEVIAEIKAEQDKGLHDHTRAQTAAYRPGERVRIVHGPWTGLLAEVLGTPVIHRSALLVEGRFGGWINLDTAALEPV